MKTHIYIYSQGWFNQLYGFLNTLENFDTPVYLHPPPPLPPQADNIKIRTWVSLLELTALALEIISVEPYFKTTDSPLNNRKIFFLDALFIYQD